MPYLGPRSFETAPLTASNLSHLNSELGQRGAASSSSSDKDVIAKRMSTTLVCTPVPPGIMNKEARDSSSSSNQSSVFDSLQSSTSPELSSQSEEDELVVSTPLSSISSTGSSGNLQTFDIPANLSSRGSTILPADNQTIVGDDENKTIVSDKPTDLHLSNSALHFSRLDSKTSKLASSSCSQFQHVGRTPLKRFSKSFVVNPSPPQLRHSPKLLRKKSGEPLKSSLKLPSLVRSESMPNSKSVRFAPRLADVKLFFRTEKPVDVSKNTSPVHHVYSKKPVWDFGMSSGSSDEEDDEAANGLLGRNECWELVANDSASSKTGVNFARFSTGSPVVLESVKLNCSGTSLIGFVFVKNLAYQKKILIRLSTDDWKSHIEVDSANYISSNHIFKYSDSSSNYDKFSFILKLDSICGSKPLVQVKYCVQYIAGGQVYWDNNHGRNYVLVLKRTGSPIRRKSSARYSSPHPSSLNSIERSLFAPDDVGFKLKKNDNFNESFNSSKKFEFQPKKAKNYLLEKIQSESCISSLATHHLSSASLNAARIPRSARPAAAIRSEFAPSIHYRRAFMGGRKPSFAPPRTRPVAFGTVNDFNDYNQIVKNFCFCSSATNSVGSSINSPSHASYATAAAGGRGLNSDFSSLCLS